MIKYKQPPQSCPFSESGFTIVESLVALLVAAVLLAAIAPVIVFSIASRVQARRIDLATQAARTYIDGVKTGYVVPPESTGTDGSGNTVSLNTFSAPAVGSLTCNANEYCSVPTTPANTLYCIDGDSGGCSISNSKDFIIQAFRYNTASINANAGYQLGLRVYRADGFSNDGALKKAPSKQATFTGGMGDRKAPLVEMTTAITGQSTSFNDLCNRLKKPQNTTNPTDPVNRTNRTCN